jgi:hypothetical protein
MPGARAEDRATLESDLSAVTGYSVLGGQSGQLCPTAFHRPQQLYPKR